MNKKLALIYVQEILKRPLNNFDEEDVDKWIDSYEPLSLKESLADLAYQVGNKKVTIYSTTYISKFLSKNCIRAAS